VNSHTICIVTASSRRPKGTILWEDYDEFLAQAETEIDAEAFHETGLARFAAFDLQFLLTGHRYYVYSEELDAVSPAELCCHTLLIDEGSRHRSYCLLLLSHVDVDEEDLREQAVKYGLEDVIDALLQYLETHGEIQDDRLPSGPSSRSWRAELRNGPPHRDQPLDAATSRTCSASSGDGLLALMTIARPGSSRWRHSPSCGEGHDSAARRLCLVEEGLGPRVRP